ncbi:MAG: 3-deoxy-7-phosphoheptulonate synthase [Clostridia bacterium]|nr:3-deoxy-7-phosphoheptulonate synthase [Clostridia bacterium]
MIVILRDDPNEKQLENLINWLRSMDLKIHESRGENHRILGLVGDTSRVDIDLISALDIVREVKRIQEPYKKANRKFHPLDTVVSTGGAAFGGGHFAVVAGPGAVESGEQMSLAARIALDAGADILYGGTFMPRTSPYSFQGLREEGMDILVKAGKEAGLPVASEITDLHELGCFDDVDVIQVGARNMQNYELLRELGRLNKPVILKRGLSSTLQEWLMSAEYILDGGNENVILCERGIRTFEPSAYASMDISSIPILRALTHLPVIADPCGAAGRSAPVPAMAAAAAAAGADGLALTVSPDPQHARAEGPQSLTGSEMKKTVAAVRRVREALREETRDE